MRDGLREPGLIVLVAVVCGAAPASAQESVFNLPGFGLPASGESARSQAVGGAGDLLPGVVFSLDNPASLARFPQAGFYLSLVGQRTRVEDRADSGEFEDVAFPMGQAVVPAWGSVVGVGYFQFVDFDAGLESTVEFEGESLPATFDAEGGIGVLAPAFAHAFNEGTSAGISLDVYLGSREVVRTIESRDAQGDVEATADTLAEDFGGFGVTLGFERALGARVRVGGAVRLRPSVSTEITAASAPGLVGREGEVDLPDEFSLGASARLSPALVAAAEVRYAGWGGFEDPDASAGRFRDAVDVGAGLEFAPTSPSLLLGPGSPLRVGARWRRLPVEVDGEAVREWAAGVGYGRSFGNWSRIEAVFEFGRRGSVEDNGLAERFLRVGIGLAAFEVWRTGDR